jgi:ZIP family zinc transporter
VLEVVVFAVASAGALVVGAAAASMWMPPRTVVAVLLAFASGALVAALAFELFEEAERIGGLPRAAVGLVLGAVVFVAADWLLERKVGGEHATGLALAAAVTLDGIPESLALGVTLAGGGSYVLLIAIVASNFAESVSGTADIVHGGSRREALLIWTGTAAVLATATVLGKVAFAEASESSLAVLLAFGAGAVLASLAATLMPEAYREGGPLVALATTGGFLLSYAVSTA